MSFFVQLDKGLAELGTTVAETLEILRSAFIANGKCDINFLCLFS